MPLDFKRLTFETLDSTSHEARRRAGESHNLAILAREQTSGHGRYGREWASPWGNLYLSLLVHDASPLPILAQLSFVTAVALGEMLYPLLPTGYNLAYKWPNDILINNKKVAGILLESATSAPSAGGGYVVIGTGLNILQIPDIPGKPVTSLKEAGVSLHHLDDPVADLAETFIASFERFYHVWKTEGFSAIRERWLQYAWNRHHPVAVNLGSKSVKGIFLGLSPQGELVLQGTDGSVQQIAAGEIYNGN